MQEVILKITESSLPNLTMVDLPGLPAKDTPLYDQVKKMVHKEVQDTRNIVLCIDW
jgi:GTPase Era involved in 16S rRNA processing